MLENRRHRFVGAGIDGNRPGAGRLQSIPADLACQAQDSEAGAVSLLGMAAKAQQMFDEGGLVACLGIFNEYLQGVLATFGHVIGQ